MDKVIYYTDELNDDFAGNHIKQISVPADYKYPSERGILWRVCAFFLYYVIARPVAVLYNFFGFGERIKNKKVMRGYKKGAFFVYANHTLVAADGFTPSRITAPKKAHIIVNPDAVSIPFVGGIVEMLGGITLGTDLKSSVHFSKEMQKLTEEKKAVYVYPEAHIWPYYTKIRPFKDVSFKYPAKADVPVFCATRVFKKRKFFKRPRAEVYVDGPFFADATLSVKEKQRALREQVYRAMSERAKLSDCEYVEYIKVENA